MKFYSLLTLMVVVFSTGSVMSMEPAKKGRLNFGLNNDLRIVSYSKQNMEFAVKPEGFVGKVIVDAIPLDAKDKIAIVGGFCRAVSKDKTVKVPYMLDGKEFAAKITALQMQDEQYNYFVKVTQANNNQ